MDLLRKFDFGLLNFPSKFGPLLITRFYSESGPKSEIRTIKKWTKIGFEHVIINFDEKLGGPKSNFRSKFIMWELLQTLFWIKKGSPAHSRISKVNLRPVPNLKVSVHQRVNAKDKLELNFFQRNRTVLHSRAASNLSKERVQTTCNNRVVKWAGNQFVLRNCDPTFKIKLRLWKIAKSCDFLILNLKSLKNLDFAMNDFFHRFRNFSQLLYVCELHSEKWIVFVAELRFFRNRNSQFFYFFAIHFTTLCSSPLHP